MSGFTTWSATRSGALALAIAALCPQARTQGDTCAQAVPVALGDTPFDTTSATPGPEPWIWPCGLAGGPDIWFSFTAPVEGGYTAETCGAVTYDSALFVLRGTCSALAPDQCSDDLCGAQSRVRFTALAGETVWLRLGGRNGASGQGVLTLRRNLPVRNPANGRHYQVLGGRLDWHSARQRAEALTFQGHRGHLATLTDLGEDQFVHFLLDGGPVGVVWHGAYQDLASPSYSEPLGGWRWVNAEPWLYDNWHTGEPNDLAGNEHFGGYWPAERWNDFALTSPSITGFVVEYETGSVGAPACVPAVPNSSGAPATLRATGRAELALNELRLVAEGQPPGAFGLYLVGLTGALVANPGGSQGNLCLAGSIGRFLGPGQVQAADAAGVTALTLDVTRLPSPTGPFTPAPGQTLHFQRWYRDTNPTATSNFTTSLAITFR